MTLAKKPSAEVINCVAKLLSARRTEHQSHTQATIELEVDANHS
jgi:hypothetical protein